MRETCESPVKPQSDIKQKYWNSLFVWNTVGTLRINNQQLEHYVRLFHFALVRFRLRSDFHLVHLLLDSRLADLFLQRSFGDLLRRRLDLDLDLRVVLLQLLSLGVVLFSLALIVE